MNEARLNQSVGRSVLVPFRGCFRFHFYRLTGATNEAYANRKAPAPPAFVSISVKHLTKQKTLKTFGDCQKSRDHNDDCEIGLQVAPA